MANMVTAQLMATVEGGVRARDDRATARTMSAADKEPTTGQRHHPRLNFVDSKPPVLAIVAACRRDRRKRKLREEEAAAQAEETDDEPLDEIRTPARGA